MAMAKGCRIFSPFTAFQITSVNARSGMRSSFEKSKVSLSRCQAFSTVFFSLISTCRGFAIKTAVFGSDEKQRHMGVAAASNWLIGGIPKINSIVRNMELVEYMV